jgi:hypothetical protein
MHITHQQIGTQAAAQDEKKTTYTFQHYGCHQQMFCLQSTSNKCSVEHYSSKPALVETRGPKLLPKTGTS